MNQQEQQEFNKMKRDLKQLQDLFFKGDFPNKKIFYKQIVAEGGIDLTGTPIAIGQAGGSVGLYGETPVAQAGAISAPAGGGTVDAQARTAIGSILTALQNIGITA